MSLPNPNAKDDGWTVVRRVVLTRDGGCVFGLGLLNDPLVAVTSPCRTRFGVRHDPRALDEMELDHVHEVGGSARKAPDDAAHLQTVCGAHHEEWAGRATARYAARVRLSGLYPEAWRRWLAR